MKRYLLILNYNNYQNTLGLLKSIDPSWFNEIVVVDNASKNNSFKKLKEETVDYVNVSIISSAVNGGYAAGNNIGLEYLQSKYTEGVVVIANPDVRFSESFLIEAGKIIESIPMAGAVTGMISNHHSAWKDFSPVKSMLISSELVRKLLPKVAERKYYKFNLDQHSDYEPVDIILGALFVIKIDVMKEISNFDSNTFLYNEENILYEKLNEKGYQNYLMLEETFTHVGGTSTVSFSLNPKKRLIESTKYYLRAYRNINFFQRLLVNLILEGDLFIAWLRIMKHKIGKAGRNA